MAFRKVFEFKELSYTFSSTGGTTAVQLYTDLPGGVMTTRLTGKTLPDTSGIRRTAPTIPLDGIEGTLFRPELVPGAATILRLF
jgi:hypothetical protein